MTVENIIKEAINLNPIDKAELISKLQESFSEDVSLMENEKLWKKEVLRRKIAFENGEIPADDIGVVFDRLAQR